jgi:Flp pilus assembly protein TadD
MLSAKIYTVVFFCISAIILSACNTQPLKSDFKGSNDNSANILNLLDPSVTTEAEAFAKGEAALAEGKTDNALFYYVKALQYNKKNIKALERIAVIHSRGKHPELARKVFQDILAIDNTNPIANESIGLYLLENGNIAQAKSHLTQAVKHSNRQWKSHNGLGVIADLEHNSAEAIAQYEAAAAIEPTNPMILNNVGYSYYLAGDEVKAKHFFNQALSFDNKYKRAIHNLALIEIKRGAYPTAIALFNRIMPTHEAFNNTGYICMLNGQYDVAEEYFQRAIDESPVYFPKAQENMNTLLTLKKNRSPYQAPAEEPYQIESTSEIEPAASVEPPVNPKPALRVEKIKKTESPAAQKSKKAALTQKESNQTGKQQQFAAKSNKKKSRPEARPIEKAEGHEQNIGKVNADTQKALKLPAVSGAEQNSLAPQPPIQEVNNKTVNDTAEPLPKPEMAQPAPLAEAPILTEQARAEKSPEPVPALSDADKPSELTLPASPKEQLPAQPETLSQPAEPIEQTKVQPLTETHAPTVTQSPTEESKPVNSPDLQVKIPAQDTNTIIPPSDNGTAQSPTVTSELKTQIQPSDTLADQSEAAPASKQAPADSSNIAPEKKNETSGNDVTTSHQK